MSFLKNELATTRFCNVIYYENMDIAAIKRSFLRVPKDFWLSRDSISTLFWLVNTAQRFYLVGVVSRIATFASRAFLRVPKDLFAQHSPARLSL